MPMNVFWTSQGERLGHALEGLTPHRSCLLVGIFDDFIPEEAQTSHSGNIVSSPPCKGFHFQALGVVRRGRRGGLSRAQATEDSLIAVYILLDSLRFRMSPSPFPARFPAALLTRPFF